MIIEYHGKQHYEFVAGWHKTQEYFETCQKHDAIKKEYAEKRGTFIEIRYDEDIVAKLDGSL